MGAEYPRTRLLLAAVLWWLSIAALIPVGRPTVNFLRDRGWLAIGVTVGLVLIAVLAIGAVLLLLRRGLLDRRQMVVAVLAAVFLFLLAQFLDRPEERLHIVQYALLGILVWSSLSLQGWLRALGAILLTGGLGWLDEGIQYLLPDRVYDLWDVFLNALSGGLGVGATEAIRFLRPQKEKAK